MKKYITVLFTVVLVTLSLCVPSFAYNEELPRVIDEAELLTSDEEASLYETIDSIADAHAFDIVILTVNSIGDKSAEEFADDYFDENGYGYGENNDGILFLISMENRDTALSTCGYGIDAFTDYGQEKIWDAVLPYLSDGAYSDAFDEFLSISTHYLESAENGTPFDEGSEPFNKVYGFLIAAAIGLVVAAVITGIERAAMKTARPQTQANAYLVRDSFALTAKEDSFLYTRTTKTKKQEPSETSGGSTTHTSSSGTTHGGSSRNF